MRTARAKKSENSSIIRGMDSWWGAGGREGYELEGASERGEKGSGRL